MSRCDGGSLARVINWDGHWKWKFHKCPKCGVVILPYVTHNLAPSWWKYVITYKIQDLRYWWKYR